MKYIRSFNEASIAMNSELVNIYNSLREKAFPIVEYFKSNYNTNNIESETSLEDFVDKYIDLTGYTYKNEIEKNIVIPNLSYDLVMYDATSQDIKRKIRVHIKPKSNYILLENNRAIHLIVWQFIKSECVDRKFINLINSFDKIRFDIECTKMVMGNRTIVDVFKHKKADLIGIVNILKGIPDENRTLVKLSPYIFKYGEEHEVKEMWDKINTLPNIMLALNNINKTSEESRRLHLPDTSGFLDRLRSIIKLSDYELDNGKNMSDMGFHD